MVETKTPRLLAAAKEFNIGTGTLIDFLGTKGFNKEELGPTAKLSTEMYAALMQEFQSEKAAKNKADQVELIKSANVDRKRKDEEDLSVKAPKVVVKEEPKPVVVAEEAPKPAPVAETPKPVEAEPVKPVAQTLPEVTKVEAPVVETPTVINKIDLSKIESSTRPKKADPKKKVAKEEPKADEIKAEEASLKKPVAKADEPVVKPEVVVPVAPVALVVPAQDAAPVIENIRAARIEGPKVVGKITLPVNSDTRPKPLTPEERRKRKRIPVENKGGPQQGGQNRGPQQGGAQQGGGFNRAGTGQGGPQQGGGFNRGPQQGGGFNRDGRSGGGPGRSGPQRGGFNRGPVGAPVRRDDKEIDQKEIQDKIRETQAKLAGNTGRGGKGMKAKARRDKRRVMEENAANLSEDNKLQVTEFVTVSELASLMDVNFTDVISKCMNLGIMVSINQRLDAEVIELVSGEFGFEVEFIGMEDANDIEDEEEYDDADEQITRAPIVTIMGHVDHGKTSLLDYIRNANVVAGEAGGITQHIGAYEVQIPNGKHITFLDTPGHEAFTAMRARGAKVTDIAVIVVAADDAVMPQTKEAISHAQAAGVPMIFAINKIDKDGANPQKIYEQLAGMNILVESWGGKFQSQELSAKQGLNVDTLLEKILLEAELLDVKANPEREATGSIIEASLDKGRGYVATILVQNGTLNLGDTIVSGQYFGKVKAMFNERNQKITTAPPSTPVVILGLNGAPQAGEKFKVYADEAEAKESASRRSQLLREQGLRARKHITLDEIGRRLALGNFKELNIIIKGDVDGSVEALSDSLQKLSTGEIAVRVVHKAVGQISESDVLLATASDAILIGFNVRPSSQANKLAENEGVQIKMYSIIYTAIDEIRSAMEGMLEPKVQEKEIATIEIREVYKFDKATIAGCYVTEGKMKRDSKIRVFRDGILVYPRTEGGYAELGSLKRFKDDMKEVAMGYECGLTIKNFSDINVGDTVVGYEEEEIKRTL